MAVNVERWWMNHMMKVHDKGRKNLRMQLKLQTFLSYIYLLILSVLLAQMGPFATVELCPNGLFTISQKKSCDQWQSKFVVRCPCIVVRFMDRSSSWSTQPLSQISSVPTRTFQMQCWASRVRCDKNLELPRWKSCPAPGSNPSVSQDGHKKYVKACCTQASNL